jgi:hypothetical protein
MLAFRRRVDELGQLRADPLRQSDSRGSYDKLTGSIRLGS